MDADIVRAEGSPSPTLVLPAEGFPTQPGPLAAALEPVCAWLERSPWRSLTKLALVGPSAEHGHGIDYRFVQLLPGGPGRTGIELRGSCGHSILAALVAAGERRLVPPLRPGSGTMVNVLNNGDQVLCQVEEARTGEWVLDAHFVHRPPLPAERLLLLRKPVTALPQPGGRIRISVVSAGNPYVFVDAADLGVHDTPTLFTAGEPLFEAMSQIRRSVADRLGWPAEGAFPKIAALLPDGAGGLAVRAVSVPSWHPTIALTGAVCLAAAAGLTGTVPYDLLGRDGAGPVLRITTPGGSTSVSAVFDTRAQGGRVLRRVGIRGKRVRYLSAAHLDVPARPPRVAALAGRHSAQEDA
ncbi:PrpF domain-containing protein [Streptomyces griseorubiginosus]|uniref:PrpF domain-containing protein n=1 Tax=Streptomyces griseorubiginosus TaxID=67304 RepID=UPI0033B5EAE4